MTRKLLAIVAILFATSLSAATITFDPPNPTSATPVTAWFTALCPYAPEVHRTGNIISISVKLGGCPLSPPPTPIAFPANLGIVPPGVYDVVVGEDDLLPAIAEGFLVVRDAAPPFDVQPNVVPVSGGVVHLVTNNGANLITCTVGVVPPVCDTFTVQVGGQTATVVSQTQYDMNVRVPPHDAGPVDVTINRNAGGPFTATAALDYFAADTPPDPAFFEPVVFPTLVTGAGAFGSQWTSDVAVRNDSTLLPLPATSSFLSAVPPQRTLTFTGASAPAGAVFYASRQVAPLTYFDVLVRDLSRQAQTLGTEIPVVREWDLYGRPIELLNVPNDPKYRVALRVLRLDGGTNADVTISSMQDTPGVGAIVADFMTLTQPSPTSTLTSASILDINAKYPQLAGKGPLRILIYPGVVAPRTVWAFVSVTNNETQDVTIISPH